MERKVITASGYTERKDGGRSAATIFNEELEKYNDQKVQISGHSIATDAHAPIKDGFSYIIISAILEISDDEREFSQEEAENMRQELSDAQDEILDLRRKLTEAKEEISDNKDHRKLKTLSERIRESTLEREAHAEAIRQRQERTKRYWGDEAEDNWGR